MYFSKIKSDKVMVKIMAILVKFVGIEPSTGIFLSLLWLFADVTVSVMFAGQEAFFYQMSPEAELPQHTN